MSSHTQPNLQMNSIEKKIALMDVLSAKEKLSLAQCAHDIEINALKECDTAVHAALQARVPMEKFLQIRESKRIQARLVRDSFRTLVAAMNTLDDAESRYDVLFFSMESMQ